MNLFCYFKEQFMEKEIVRFTIPSLPINIVTLNYQRGKNYRDLHLHKEIEIIRVLKGRMLCTVGESIIPLRTNEILLINKGVAHKLEKAEGDVEFSYIQIDIDKLSGEIIDDEEQIFYSFIGEKNRPEYMLEDGDGELSKLFSLIVGEANEKALAFELYIKSAIFNIIAYMSRKGLLPYEQNKAQMKMHKIADVIKYINKNYDSEITLDSACKIIGISKYYFCRLFKEICGSSFTEYLNFVRLNYVEKALYSTDKSISEIAFDCGFTSIQYFNRVFKKHKKCTPSDYRRLMIEEAKF